MVDVQPAPAAVDLYWLPLGAGSSIVPRCGRLYEAAAAAREHRDRHDLHHAALEVHLDGARWTIESAPSWDRADPDRGVVATGPVGMRALGRSRWFRYEVRCWRDGRIPDLDTAVGGAHRVSQDRERAAQALECVRSFPPHTWGRDEQQLGDMWNSNSLVAWVLAGSGHDVATLAPPPRGRAPGWAAGLEAARRAVAPEGPVLRGPWSLSASDTRGTTGGPTQRG